MTRAARLLLPAVLLALALPACSAKTDIGQTCRMTKPCDPGPTCPILYSELTTDESDYIALGAAECDDLVCVRLADSSKTPARTEPADEAIGYCARPCIDSMDCEYDWEGKKGLLACEPLLLTDTSLFGPGASTRYCVYPRDQID